jgi:hypothetical protein
MKMKAGRYYNKPTYEAIDISRLNHIVVTKNGKMKIHLDLIESRLRQVIETWIVPFNRSDFQHRLAHQVVEAMRHTIIIDAEGRAIAPNQFKLRLNPSIVDELKGTSLLERLPEVLSQAARDANVNFLRTPELRLEPDETFTLDEIAVHAQGNLVPLGKTAALRLKPQTIEPFGDKANADSFLILSDDRIYPLRLQVINLGRRPDNHLVIDDPRISRIHAQISLKRGHYILFDLNSTGGTCVNGQRIRQHTLKPGDVISLAGIALIYGEEPIRGEDVSDTTQVTSNPSQPSEDHQ